jgi:hypothetical protein
MAQLVHSCFALLAVGVSSVVMSTITIHNTQVRPVASVYCETRMSNDEPQQTEWETEVGLSEETTYVALYPSRKHAEEWMEEAEEQGYGSRSKYLYELIQEARAARQEGFLAYSQNESKVEELQLKVEQLQDDHLDGGVQIRIIRGTEPF